MTAPVVCRFRAFGQENGWLNAIDPATAAPAALADHQCWRGDLEGNIVRQLHQATARRLEGNVECNTIGDRTEPDGAIGRGKLTDAREERDGVGGQRERAA